MTTKNHNQLKNQRQENPTHIQDEGLSLEMAYAQKPHIEQAQKAMKQGKFAEVSGHLATAEAISSQSVESFINQQQAKLDELRQQVGATNKHETETSFETKVANNIKALAEHYNLPEEDFNLVSYETEDGETKHTVMYTALQGIDLGDSNQGYDKKRSYDSLMADDSHILDIDGNKTDTRSLTTQDYINFINQEIAKNTDGPLPDSRGLVIWTGSLLPGEPTDGDLARYGLVYGDDRPYVDWIRRDGGGQGVRFRPAVKIPQS